MSLKHLGMHIWEKKFFFYCSNPTITGSRSTILIFDFWFVVSWIGIFQKCTKRLIGALKRLFGPQKIFQLWTPDYSDSWFADYGDSKMIFFKSSPNGLWAPGGSYFGLKIFSNCGGKSLKYFKIHWFIINFYYNLNGTLALNWDQITSSWD